MNDNRHTVGGELHVEFDAVSASVNSHLKRRESILRRVRARSAMSDYERAAIHFFSSKKIVFDHEIGSVIGNS